MKMCQYCRKVPATMLATFRDKWALDQVKICEGCVPIAERDSDFINVDYLDEDEQEEGATNATR